LSANISFYRATTLQALTAGVEVLQKSDTMMKYLQCLLHIRKCQQVHWHRLTLLFLLWQGAHRLLLCHVFSRELLLLVRGHEIPDIIWVEAPKTFVTKLSPQCHHFCHIILSFYAVLHCCLSQVTKTVNSLWTNLPADSLISATQTDGICDGIRFPDAKLLFPAQDFPWQQTEH
jgi:hypothetical protein